MITPKQKALVAKYDSLIKKQNKLYKELKDLTKEANKIKCPHTRFYIRDEDRDNGYGKWWKVTIKTCKICHKSFDEYGHELQQRRKNEN